MQSYRTLWQVVKKYVEQHFFATDYLDPENSIVVVLAKSGTCRKVWSHKLSFGGPPPDENAFLANMKAASQAKIMKIGTPSMQCRPLLKWSTCVPYQRNWHFVFLNCIFDHSISTICLSHKSTLFCTHNKADFDLQGCNIRTFWPPSVRLGERYFKVWSSLDLIMKSSAK